MNPQKWIILLVALGLMGGGACLLTRIKSRHHLGVPGVRATAIPGSPLMDIPLPETVLDYRSVAERMDAITIAALPADTSLSRRRYQAPDGFATLLSVVLMGADRTSIHKSEACLTAQGWHIDESTSAQITVPVAGPVPYGLPVMKLQMSREAMREGKPEAQRGVYMYWFVADQQVTASHLVRMVRMADGLLRTGVLQRWAYISCFAVCAPGNENATCERMEKFITAAVPQFQLATGPRISAAGARGNDERIGQWRGARALARFSELWPPRLKPAQNAPEIRDWKRRERRAPGAGEPPSLTARDGQLCRRW